MNESTSLIQYDVKKKRVKTIRSNQHHTVNSLTCKPCFVVLERLSEEKLSSLLSLTSLQIEDIENILSGSVRLKKERNNHRKSKSLNKIISPQPICVKPKNNSQRRQSVVPGSGDARGRKKQNKTQQLDESPASYSNQNRDNKFHLSLSDHIPNGGDFQIPEEDIKDSAVNPDNYDNKTLKSKRFRLSLNKKAALNYKSTKNRGPNPGSKCPQAEDPESTKRYENNLVDSVKKKRLLKRFKLSLSKSVAHVQEKDIHRQECSTKTLDVEDLENIMTNSIDTEDKSESGLSLKKKTSITEDNDVSGVAPHTNILKSTDFQKSAGSEIRFCRSETNLRHPKVPKLSLKRKIINTEHDVVPKLKLKRNTELQSTPRADEVNELHSQLYYETSVVRQSKEKDAVKSPEPVSKHKICQRINGRLFSTMKLKRNANGRILRRNCKENQNVPFVRHKTDMLESELNVLHENGLKKIKTTKITDYFANVIRSNTVSDSNSKHLKTADAQSRIKKKFGIHKEPVVQLMNLTLLKAPTSSYQASEILKLNEKYGISQTDLNVLHKTTNVLCSISSSSTNDPISNNTKLSVNANTTDSVHIHIAPLDKNLPPERQILQAENHSSTGFKEHALKNNSSLERGTPETIKDKVASCGTDRAANDLIHQDLHNKQNHTIDNEEVPNRDTNCTQPSIINSVVKLEAPLSTVDALTHNSSDSQANLTINVVANETQVQESHVENELIEPNILLDTRCATSPVYTNSVSGAVELGKLLTHTSLTRKDSNSTANVTYTCPTLSPLLKPSINLKKSEPHVREDKERLLPINGMTRVNCEMMDKDNSWIRLMNDTDNMSNDCVQRKTIAKPVQELDECSETTSVINLPNNEENISCTSTNNICDNSSNSLLNLLLSSPPAVSLPNNDLTATVETADHLDSNEEGRLSPIFKGKSPSVRKSIISEVKGINRKRSLCKEIEACASAEARSTGSEICQEQSNDLQERSDTVSETKLSSSSAPVVEEKSLPEDSADTTPILSVNQETENSQSDDHDLTDAREEGPLYIDTDDSAESQPAEKEVPTLTECIICKVTFKHLMALEKHLLVHIRESDGSCSICEAPLSKKIAMKHYLEHCGYTKENEIKCHNCTFCHRKFRKEFALINHMKLRHKDSKQVRLRQKISQKISSPGKCSICPSSFNSQEKLFSHVLTHSEQELQDAYKLAKAKQQLQPSITDAPQSQDSNALAENGIQCTEQRLSDLTETNDTSTTSPAATPNCEISMCMCHKDERLEISKGSIIEVALVCEQCKTFFKTRKCFKSHYNNASCTWSSKSIVTPTMYCNKCGIILNSLQEMHIHLTEHTNRNVEMNTSFLCKHCNIFFFGVGSLFYAHWFSHCDNPLFLADHCTFPNNFKVKIIEPECTQSADVSDEPTESLFIADHQCLDCKKPFHTEEALKKHFISSATCSRTVETVCQVGKNSKLSFMLLCSMCNKDFSDKLMFDNHMKEHDAVKDFLDIPKPLNPSSRANELTCHTCNVKYLTVATYNEHLIKHEIIQAKFICNYCTLAVNSLQEFKLHSTKHKGTPKKPITCKVTFTIAEFHCKTCKIWFNDQLLLNEHQAMHYELVTPTLESVEDPPTKTVSVVEKKTFVCVTCKQEFTDQVNLDAHVSTHQKDLPASLQSNLNIIRPTGDSDSTSGGTIPAEKKGQNEISVQEDTALGENKKENKLNTEETKKSVFIRVKNLTELLPYACSVCKAEFDTQQKLSNHLCRQPVIVAQDFMYRCTLCREFRSNNAAEWNQHKLSHFPRQDDSNSKESGLHRLNTQQGQIFFHCNICQNFKSLSNKGICDHIAAVHRDTVRQYFVCRICHNFRTEHKHEILRHEAAHTKQQLQSMPLLSNVQNNLSQHQPANSLDHLRPPISSPSVTSVAVFQPVNNFNNDAQPNSVVSTVNTNNSLALQLIYNSNGSQQQTNQQVLTPPVSTLGHNLPRHTISSVTTSGYNLTQFPQAQCFNNFQQSSTVAPLNNVTNNLSAIQAVDNSNKFQQIASIPPTNGSGNSPLVRIRNNGQWMLTTVQTAQVLFNNASPFNNMTNVMHALPSHIPSSLYCCNICKSVIGTSEEALKAHQALHANHLNLADISKRSHCCKHCPNISYSSEEQLRLHMQLYHNSESLNVPQSQIQPNVTKSLYRCKQCPQIFMSSSQVVQHMYMCHRFRQVSQQLDQTLNQNYPYTCHKCSTTGFLSEAELQVHVSQMHTDIALLQQAVMDTTSTNLTDNQNLLKCTVCGLLLISEATLNYHMKSHNVAV